ncbi:MAG: hypothetical protein ICV72_03445, partial [Aldersonia sp.]|nr:hypothetical protein [Aldersonia sp.]
MRAAGGPPGPRYKFSLLGTDWVEWLLVAVLCVVSAVGVFVLGGSIVTVAITAGLVILAAAAV